MWRNWKDEPPQIPWAPVICWCGNSDCNGWCSSISYKHEVEEQDGQRIVWRPTGIYREEFYQVTGRWE